uniref:Putative conserved plasma membrane protein n=1 Tax=Panstrongylus lignarius TaxID=156445 RepID=A0A224XNV8_9HEMI
MQGAKRVIIFCLLIAVLPVILLFIPLYLRHKVYADVKYQVAESDILEMINGISSVFCQEHSLNMETPFNAFQTKGKPQMSTTIRKHIRLKKSMILPDDTLEYWGFFLPSSSTVHLSVCSRYDGSCILVVKGEKNLRDCGLMQPSKPPEHLAENKNIYVTQESAIQIVADEQETLKEPIDPEENGGEENDDDEEPVLDALLTTTESYNNLNKTDAITDTKDLTLHKHRHERSRFRQRKRALEKELNRKRRKRQAVTYKLDGGIAHGGNALNYSGFGNDSSVSSFENSLLTCYKGQTLLFREFASTRQCNSTAHLEKVKHMTTVHNVTRDGYYYYIFYSDNDYVQNDIYAIFDIYKPTYEYGNHSMACINKTECSFPIGFWSDDIVVVEVPTRDGIENENDDITILTSTCHPRSAIYAVFPIAVIFIILLCAFI